MARGHESEENRGKQFEATDNEKQEIGKRRDRDYHDLTPI